MATAPQRRTVKQGEPFWFARAAKFRAVGAPTDRKFQFLASDASVDRMGDTIAIDGWDCKDFVRNPVILFSHDNQDFPVGTAEKIWADEKGLHVIVQISDVTETDRTVFAKLSNGDLRAVSVGFKPTEMEWVEREDEDGNITGGIDFKRQELLEISICSVPANANALIEARTKAMGRTTKDGDVEMSMGPEHVKALGEHVKTMGEHCKTLGDHIGALQKYVQGDDAVHADDKAFTGTLKSLGLDDATIASVCRAADQAHAMHPDVHKCVGAAHKSLTKALNLHNGAAGGAAADATSSQGGNGDGEDDDDQKAMETLAANQKRIDELTTRMTGRMS